MFDSAVPATNQLRAIGYNPTILLQEDVYHQAAGKAAAFVAPEMAIHAAIIAPGVLGLIYATVMYLRIRSIAVSAEAEEVKALKDPQAEEKIKKMNDISGFIAEGAETFLIEEAKYMLVYMVLFGGLIYGIIDVKFTEGKPYATVAFLVGCLTSLAAGWIGMQTAVMCNVRCAYECWVGGLPRGYQLAVNGGSVMGMALVSLGTLSLYGLIIAYRSPAFLGTEEQATQLVFEAIAGFGLGGSSIALFARVGGGIYTKAADVGADLAGKNEWGLNEDDPRNPACIADNVGDNVGDVAGMGADLFGSFAEATCATLVIASAVYTVEPNTPPDLTMYPGADPIRGNFNALMFPLILTTSGIVVGALTLLICGSCFKISETPDVSIERGLKGILIVSTVLQTPATIGVAFLCLPPTFHVEPRHVLSPMICAVCVLMGLWSGLIIGFVTEYYTSHSYRPVRQVAESQDVSAATGIIFGLALGYKSTIIPCICLGITIAFAHTFAGMFGVALAAIGMLGTLACALAIDVYGPISDNAGGIAEMSGLEENVRERTDALDAAGNTTAAVGKGFAIGSAALVSLALFGAYCVRTETNAVNILNQWTFAGLLYGAMMPFWFSAMTMKSVGEAANDMVRECNRQFPQIMEGQAPDYKTCVSISTQASLREMIGPGALVILSPIIFGCALGKNACAGLLSGALVAGVMMAVSMSNTGGAWDNAKKYIEAGGLGEGKGKKSQAHKNAVTGDTVGDPMKDTSGPALNIVIKLSAIISLVFGAFIKQCSNPDGGPKWIGDISPNKAPIM